MVVEIREESSRSFACQWEGAVSFVGKCDSEGADKITHVDGERRRNMGESREAGGQERVWNPAFEPAVGY